jgi:hypothetical protein
MGSGKGKMYAWGFKTFGGTIFFEIKNTPYGRSKSYFNQLSDALNCYTKFEIFKSTPTVGYSGGFLTRSFSNRIYYF